MRLVCLLAMPAACSGSGTSAEDGRSSVPIAVGQPINETGHGLDASTLSGVAKAIADDLRADGLPASADTRMHAALIVQPRVTQCPGPPHPASLTTRDNDGGCLGSVTVIRQFTTRTAFTAVARTPPGGDLAQLGIAMAQEVTRGLRPQAGGAATPEHDITATGMTVRHLGDGRFVIGDETIDLHAIPHSHDPAVDTDVPEATNVTLNDTVAPMDHAAITLYQVDPPLTGQPSREVGIDRGTDFRDPADLVQAAYSNYVSPVLTEDPEPIRIASHPIGHFIVKVEIPGYPTVLTGMTTIARADTELVKLTIGRQLGIGGVLLTPQPGRLNTSTEVARELALRQRRLRVVDGLYFHTSHGRNIGPEYVFDDGRVVFARVKLPVANATDALAYFVEFIHRGQQNRFGSLLNSPFKGTGAGCAAFAMSWLQAAGAIPFITEPAPDAGGSSDTGELWRASRARLHVPWRLLGCDERVGAAKISSAQLTIYDLLFHGSTSAFIRAASEGLAAHIRESYGAVPATLFQIGALTPLRDLVVNGRRKDPGDRADYTWSGPGIDFSYWDNSRFAAWIRRVWENGPRDPHVTLAREGRFIGVAIDAMATPRQRAPFFAAADRARIRRDDAAPALTCQDVFNRGLE